MSNADAMNLTPEQLAKFSGDELLALFEQLKSAVKEAKKIKPDTTAVGEKLFVKVSDKGALSIYGGGKFPFSPYVNFAKRLFQPEVAANILAFITEHESEFSVKPPKAKKAGAETETEVETEGTDTDEQVQEKLDNMEVEPAK